MGATVKYQTGLNLNRHIRGEKVCRNLAALLSSFLLAFVFASIFTPVQNSDALTCTDGSGSGSTGTTGQICRSASSTMNVQVNNPYYVTVSSSAGSGSGVALDYTTASGNKLGDVIAASDTVTTTSNTGRPKYLYISTTSSSNDLTNSNTDLSNDKTYISAGGGDSISTASSLDSNTWGFALPNTTSGLPSANTFDPSYDSSALSSTSKFTKVPTLGNDILIQGEIGTESTDEEGAGTGEYISTASIYYGALATASLNAGKYSNTILYTAFTTEPPVTPTMQEFTTAECNALTEATSENYDTVKITLRDSRDDKTYTIARMKDGNCWMTANLALDGMDSSGAVRTLTLEDSNVTTSRILSGDTTEEWTSATGKYDEMMINIGKQNDIDINGNKIGNLYNFNAATAGVTTQETTGNVYESICPKNWRMPDNGTDANVKSFAKLFASYGLPTSESTHSAESLARIKVVEAAPINFTLYSDSWGGNGVSGGVWSRTAGTTLGNNYAYDAFMAYSNTTPDTSNLYRPQEPVMDKRWGVAVRCVFEGDQIQNNMFMQDVNLTMCNNLAESTTSADNRRTVVDGRDNKTYRISHLADGNCWMVQNLALDGGRDLFPGSSNVTAKRTLNPNISSGTTSVNTTDQIYSGVANNYTSNCGSYPYCVTNTEPYGNLYNFMAATATVGDANATGVIRESVCPSNCHLPLEPQGTPSYYSLLTMSYGMNQGANGTSVQDAQKAPFYFTLAGDYANTASGQGLRVSYQIGKLAGDANAYQFTLNSNSGDLYTVNAFRKHTGYSVRCVLGE